MTFYTAYKAVFDAVYHALNYVAPVAGTPKVPAHDDVPEVPAVPAVLESGVKTIKTVILGGQFSVGNLPKAIINPEPCPIVIWLNGWSPEGLCELHGCSRDS